MHQIRSNNNDKFNTNTIEKLKKASQGTKWNPSNNDITNQTGLHRHHGMLRMIKFGTTTKEVFLESAYNGFYN